MNRILVILAITVFISGCTPAQFAAIRGLSEKPLICDPFSNENSTNSQLGIEGSIYYLKSNQPRYNHVADYLQFGELVNAELFLSKLFVPTRAWGNGFVNEDGKIIKDGSNNLLIEYFGLHLESSIILTANDTEGDYQFGLLSDDGTILDLQLPGQTNYTRIVDNDGDHPTKFGCSSTKVNFTRNTVIPMNLDYYQGPRYHIALIPMWRKFPTDPTKVQDPLCGVSGNNTFFDSTQVPSGPQQAYNDLLSRSWRPLESGNYLLKSGTNRCVR